MLMKRYVFSVVMGIWVVSGLAALAAVKAKSVPAPDGQRFLFIVDVSSSMERLQAATEAAIYEMLGSGVKSQMWPGDTYGLWTFNKETFAGKFPMQIWDSRNSSQLGTIAAAFLSDQTCEKSSNVKLMIATLTSLVRAVSNLNVFIVSNGDSLMTGTPFDKEINAEYKSKRKERREAEQPFITTLVVRDGWIISGSVTIAGQPIDLPQRPLPVVAEKKAVSPPKPIGRSEIATAQQSPSSTPQIAVVTTPTAGVAVGSEAAAVMPEPPPTRPRVIQIITRTNAVAATQPATPESPKTNIVLASTLGQTNVALTEISAPEPPSPAASPTTPASATAAQSAPHGSSGEASPAHSALAAILPPPIPVAARELHPEPNSAKPASLATFHAGDLAPRHGLGAGVLLAFGGVLMTAALFLLFLVLRRYRPAAQGSLITQSMQRR